MTTRHLLIFAKIPEPGRTKTRLIPALGPERANAVYELLLRHTLGLANELRQICPVHITLWIAGGSIEQAQDCFGSEYDIRLQTGDDLGARLSHATAEAFSRGASQLVVVGTDCAELAVEHLVAAFTALDREDTVLGPAWDGGYYLIGLKKDNPTIFQQISWSSSQVLEQTISQLNKAHLTYQSLRTLADVDEPEDLLPLRSLNSHWHQTTSTIFPRKSDRLSVIIPTLNEESCLPRTLTALGSPNEQLEVIVADAGSHDETVAIAERFGCKIIRSARGRSQQLNAAAAVATGATLLFLHADTLVPRDYRSAIDDAIANQPDSLGCFQLGIEDQHFIFRILELGVVLRSRLCGLPYGDQAFFMRSDVFYGLNGFKKMPIMEDYEFVRRFKNIRQNGKRSKIALLPQRVQTSARRWQRRGICYTTLLNQICLICYHLGVNPEKIARIYRNPWGAKQSKAAEK